MPARHLILLLIAVVAGAGLTVGLAAVLAPAGAAGPGAMGGLLIGAMVLRLLVRRRDGR